MLRGQGTDCRYLEVEILRVLGSAPKPELEKVGDEYAVIQVQLVF
jgi:hypothetical protein